MLSKTELQFLKGDLELSNNLSYERVITCRIRKKVERRIDELQETIPLLLERQEFREWFENYRITVISNENESYGQNDGQKEKPHLSFPKQNKGEFNLFSTRVRGADWTARRPPKS